MRCPIWNSSFTVTLNLLHSLGNASVETEAYCFILQLEIHNQASWLKYVVMILTYVLKVSAINIGWETNCPAEAVWILMVLSEVSYSSPRSSMSDVFDGTLT